MRQVIRIIIVFLLSFNIGCSGSIQDDDTTFEEPSGSKIDNPVIRIVDYHDFQKTIMVSDELNDDQNPKEDSQKSSEKLQTKPGEKEKSYIMLIGSKINGKQFVLQTANATEREKTSVSKPYVFDKVKMGLYENGMRIVGIYKNLICLQKVDKEYYFRSDPAKARYTLLLYDLDNFDLNKPLFKKTYAGAPGTAFYIIDNQIFIGSRNEVRRGTIENNSLTLWSIYEFKDKDIYKTIDVFVRFKNKLLAIDDVMRPYYGFLFDIEKVSQPKFLEKLSLPEDLNIHYEDAVSDGETIYTFASYGHSMGTGEYVFALKYEAKKLFIKYIYKGFVAQGYVEPQEHQGHFYPNLEGLYLLEDKLLSAGMGGIIEMNTDPKLTYPDLKELTSVEEFNKKMDSYDYDAKIQYAVDKTKLHEFDGIIKSIAVDSGYVYALNVIYEKKPEFHKMETYEGEIKKVELLVLKYDKENKTFKKIQSIEVDKRISKIYVNK